MSNPARDGDSKPPRALPELSMKEFSQLADGARETFESYYRKQRRKQARLVLQPPSNMVLRGGGSHPAHTQGLVNRAYIDELWEMALSKTIAALRTHSTLQGDQRSALGSDSRGHGAGARCPLVNAAFSSVLPPLQSYCSSDPGLVLDLKNLIVLFADTLQGYGFPVNQLFDMLLEVQEQYSETLLKKWAGLFRNILDSDNYSPIPVGNEDVYKKIVGQFPFQDAELEKQPFPKKFPFSEFVPKVYSQIKEFIYACLKFSEDLHLRLNLPRRHHHLPDVTSAGVLAPPPSKSPLVQIIINTTHLEKSCKFLEEFITNITNVLPETVHTTKLYGTTTFKDARHAAEEEIYTNLNQKIDQFLQLADYDWMAPEPGGRASDYLVDLIGFLRSTFAVFTHLPMGFVLSSVGTLSGGAGTSRDQEIFSSGRFRSALESLGFATEVQEMKVLPKAEQKIMEVFVKAPEKCGMGVGGEGKSERGEGTFPKRKFPAPGGYSGFWGQGGADPNPSQSISTRGVIGNKAP
ncbi:hypothetical protein DUI87_22115 [Hirundo rustica rustica]|uniref:Exocyst complex subunit EXOC6/Sec15 C-terminal domain-containing protein n=1 Tax=Hirundo rustica rustica TaxID=333673 RepID=A0A3M0JJZ0_HIRRU|nr:hypothetical protein DUI87_22115 [Hirundo rustica rustica]